MRQTILLSLLLSLLTVTNASGTTAAQRPVRGTTVRIDSRTPAVRVSATATLGHTPARGGHYRGARCADCRRYVSLSGHRHVFFRSGRCRTCGYTRGQLRSMERRYEKCHRCRPCPCDRRKGHKGHKGHRR